MPKKRSLKHAFASFTRQQQQQQTHQKAVQDAAKRKAHSLTKPYQHHAKPSNVHHTATPPAPDTVARTRIVNPFTPDDTILIVGEANFSFTLSLLLPPRSHSPAQLLATAYDSEAECYKKYPDAQANVNRIRRIATRHNVVVFGVDAGQLDKCKHVTGKTKLKLSQHPLACPPSTKRWSKVWFGFPHVGAGHKDESRNVLSNQLLLLRFFISVAPYLTDGPLPSHAASALSQPVARAPRANSQDLEDDLPPASTPDEANPANPEGFDIVSALADATDAEKEAIATSRAAQPLRPPVKRGSVLITLRNAPPYTLWNVSTLGKRLPEMLSCITPIAPPLAKGCKKPSLSDLDNAGLSRDSKPNPPPPSSSSFSFNFAIASSTQWRATRNAPKHYQLWRSFEFHPTAWKGYQHRRTVGWVDGLSTGDNEDLLRNRNVAADPNERKSRAGGGECRTWEFGLD